MKSWDLNRKRLVTIDFKNKGCISATFEGAIPDPGIFEFDNIDSCTFEKVVNAAWGLWEIEYEKSKN